MVDGVVRICYLSATAEQLSRIESRVAASTPLGDIDRELLRNEEALSLMGPAQLRAKSVEFERNAFAGGDTCATVTYVDRSFDVERRIPSDYASFKRIASLVSPAEFWETFGRWVVGGLLVN